MATGIYQYRMLGSPEVSQKNIDYWCDQCKYPTEGIRCKDKLNIQDCFDLPDAHHWHLAHECPFAHKTKLCICNQKAKLDNVKSSRDKTAD